jgi:aminopeptidase N
MYIWYFFDNGFFCHSLRYLNLTLTASSDIRKQDGARAFTSVAKNYVGYEIAYDFLYTNIAEIAR